MLRGLVGLSIGCDHLDSYWRWKLVERQMARIYYADAIPVREPEFSVEGLGGPWAVPANHGTAPHAVGTVKHRGLDHALRITRPRIQVGMRNSHQAASRVQP